MTRQNYECRCKQGVRTLKAAWWVFGKGLTQFSCFFTSESLKGIRSVLRRRPPWLSRLLPVLLVLRIMCQSLLIYLRYLSFLPQLLRLVFLHSLSLLPRRLPTSLQQALRGSVRRSVVDSEAVRSTLILSRRIFGHCLV
ncbi:unnamed protein product, partial [Ixodes pacificus]